MHKPPMDQKIMSNRKRSRSYDSPQKYLSEDMDEHAQLHSTPKVQTIDITALQKKNIQPFKFSIGTEQALQNQDFRSGKVTLQNRLSPVKHEFRNAPLNAHTR